MCTHERRAWPLRGREGVRAAQRLGAGSGGGAEGSGRALVREEVRHGEALIEQPLPRTPQHSQTLLCAARFCVVPQT